MTTSACSASRKCAAPCQAARQQHRPRSGGAPARAGRAGRGEVGPRRGEGGLPDVCLALVLQQYGRDALSSLPSRSCGVLRTRRDDEDDSSSPAKPRPPGRQAAAPPPPAQPARRPAAPAPAYGGSAARSSGGDENSMRADLFGECCQDL